MGEILIINNISDNVGNVITDTLKYTLISGDQESFLINYPNPFSSLNNEQTFFRYSLPIESDHGSLIIYDAAGKVVFLKSLEVDELSVGTHTIPWGGNTNYGLPLASGVYFSVIKFSNYITRTNKIAIIND